MPRYTLPGSNRIIYLLTKDETEVTCDIRALHEILDKTEAEIHKIREYLQIISENQDDNIQNSNEPTE